MVTRSKMAETIQLAYHVETRQNGNKKKDGIRNRYGKRNTDGVEVDKTRW